MIRDTLLCIVSSLNILLFSFIGLNYEAFQKILTYTPHSEVHNSFEVINKEVQKQLHLSSSQEQKKLKKERTLEELQSWEGILSIPKIQLIAPIHYSNQATLESIQEQLKTGTVSLNQLTPLSRAGQTIIFGHSSDYAWNNNPYGSIFALLPQLQAGDKITLIRNKRSYEYRVQETMITDPNLSTLIESTITSNQLILSTCYPIGFSNKRFNVIASPLSAQMETQISPEEKKSKKSFGKPKRPLGPL